MVSTPAPTAHRDGCRGTMEPHGPRVATDPLCARGRGDERWELGRRFGCGLGSQAFAEIRGGIPLGSELAQLYGVGSGLGRLDKTGSRSDAPYSCSRRWVHHLCLLYRHGSAQGVPLATMPEPRRDRAPARGGNVTSRTDPRLAGGAAELHDAADRVVSGPTAQGPALPRARS